MKSRVIQDEAEPTDLVEAPAASAGATQANRELLMEAVAVPLPDVLDVPYRGPAVSAQDLVRRYGEGDTAVDALRGVSLDVPQGQLTAVMGPSGSGKSTLMHILAGLDKPTEGSVQVAGTSIQELNDNDLTKLRREHIGFISSSSTFCRC